MSLVRPNVSFSVLITSCSPKKLSTEGSHMLDHSGCGGSISTRRMALEMRIQSVTAFGQAVLIVLPENRLLTLFSSKLMVSTRLVTPITAIP